jgi:hypothetical protein
MREPDPKILKGHCRRSQHIPASANTGHNFWGTGKDALSPQQIGLFVASPISPNIPLETATPHHIHISVLFWHSTTNQPYYPTNLKLLN